jgi:hypothetical protein
MVAKLDKGALVGAPVGIGNSELQNLAESILDKCTATRDRMFGYYFLKTGKEVKKITLELHGHVISEFREDLIRKLSVLSQTHPGRPIAEYVSLQS